MARLSGWSALSDARLLPNGVPAVDAVTSCAPGGEHVGATRSCSANLSGQSGTMVERCIEYRPKTRLAYLVDDETFGMGKMFDDYGFSLDLDPVEAGRTRVRIETNDTPRNPIYSTLNAAFTRRKFRRVCHDIVNGLETFAETRETATTP